MTSLEIALLAARLFAASVVVLIAPGLLLLRALRADAAWPERVTFAFALSYCWIFVLAIAVPLFGWNADAAALLTALMVAALAVAAIRRRGRPLPVQLSRADILLVVVVIAAAAAAWVIESPFTGEEVLDLASIARFADGGAISFTNTSLLPDARPVYLFQPYQLALGIIARWSGVEPMVAFIKFRAVMVPLALIFLFSLVRRLVANRDDVVPVFAVILLFVALDFETWEMNSLFPLVRRGGAGAALCVPVMLFLCVAATRRPQPPDNNLLRRLALVTAPVMLAASLTTHPLEMFTLLYFAAGMGAVIVGGFDRHGDRRQALILVTLLAATAVSYIAIQSRLVPYVAEYEQDEKQSRRDELADFAGAPVAAIAGQPSPGQDMLTRTVPATSALVFGTVALPLAAVIAPAAAAMLAVGIVPLALMYAAPAGYLVLTLMTSVETVRDVNAYFSLLGLIALALALTAAAHLIMNAAAPRHGGLAYLVKRSLAVSIAAAVVLVIGRAAARALAEAAAMEPRMVLAAGILAAVAALIVGGRARGPRLRRSPFPTGVAVVTTCLAIPFAQPEAGIGGAFTTRRPVDVITRFQIARTVPSVLEWDGYYERLRQTIAPPLPVPRAVVDEMRRRMPARQILLADPRYSCALVVLINAYCINPASIYGHYFQPAVAYYRGYVAERASDSPVHPFFNSTTALSVAERALIGDYGIDYLLTDPQFGGLIEDKLARAGQRAQLEMTLDGYRLYRITSSAARTPGQ